MANTLETIIPFGVERDIINKIMYSLHSQYEGRIICKIDLKRKFTIKYVNLTDEEIFKIGMFISKSIEKRVVEL